MMLYYGIAAARQDATSETARHIFAPSCAVQRLTHADDYPPRQLFTVHLLTPSALDEYLLNSRR